MNMRFPVFMLTLLLLVLSLFVMGSQAGSAISPQIKSVEQAQIPVHADNTLAIIRSWAEKLSPFSRSSGDDFQWVETTHVKYDLREQATVFDSSTAEAYSLEPVAAEGGMPHPMGSGFLHGVGKVSSSLAEAIPDEQNLVLNVNLPAGLFLNSADVIWKIKPQDSKHTYQLHGQEQALFLPIGMYDVSLNIGHYQERQLIRLLPKKIANAAFAGNIGRLQVYSEELANWNAVSVQPAGIEPVSVRSQGLSRQLDAIVAAGEYDVTAVLGETRQNIRVRVDKGKTRLAYMDIPGGRVNLVAILNNAPALRPMEWKVFRLDEGRRQIPVPGRHSVTMRVPAGHYQAIAIMDGKQRSREFTVTDGADSNVILAMD